MLTETVLLLGIIAVVNAIFRTFRWRKRNPPPEPPAYPFVGHLNIFNGDKPLYEAFAEFTADHGPILQFRLGTSKLLVLNNAESVQEAFVKRSEDFAGRPKIFSISLLSRNDSGIVFCDFSPAWKFHKRLAGTAVQRFLRPVLRTDDGRMISLCEKAVWDEVDILIENWKNDSRDEMDLTEDLKISLMNTVCLVTFSRRYESNHPELRAFFEANQNLKKIFRPGHPLDLFPFLRVLPWQRLRTIEELVSTRDAILEREYQYHLKTYNPSHIRNITDALLSSSGDANNNNTECRNDVTKLQEGTMSEDHVIMAMWEVFSGGFESTLQALRWAIAFLVNNPQVQLRIRHEMNVNLPNNRPVAWDDRYRLPYLMATILETLRKSSFSSLNAPHRTTRDTKVGGYDVSQDTTVFTNLWWIHNNPETWAKPHLFYPEHFLDENGNVFTPKCFFPFSVGARWCLGEKMAKMQLFLFLGRILQSFRLELPPGEEPSLPEPMSSDPVRVVGPFAISMVRDEGFSEVKCMNECEILKDSLPGKEVFNIEFES